MRVRGVAFVPGAAALALGRLSIAASLNATPISTGTRGFFELTVTYVRTVPLPSACAGPYWRGLSFSGTALSATSLRAAVVTISAKATALRIRMGCIRSVLV
jgi:hypothetical protein